MSAPFDSSTTDSALPPAANQPAPLFWAVWSVVAAFGTYFCMFGFRKPFTAATYDDVTDLVLSFKTVLVTSQVAGYMVSKFLGIKVIAEMRPERRALGILLLIICAQVGLLLFAVIPAPWNAAGLFVNGLALGMVFGLVLGFLEGRRFTEALTAGLCASFILADGVTKSLGAWLLTRGFSEAWMPAVAGWLSLGPLVVGVWMLSRIPPPDARDIAARAQRARLSRADRWSLFGRYAGGLSLLIAMYLVVSILRSIRADFAPEIWRGLGQAAPPAIFTQSERWVALGVLVINGAAIFIVDNRRAFFAALLTCGAGFTLIAAALLGWRMQALDSFGLMVLLGLGLYLPYVAVHTTIFERLLAMTRDRGNIGFLMYVADAVGYLGYVAVMLGREIWLLRRPAAEATSGADSFVDFFLLGSWLTCGVSLVCLVLAWRYFAHCNAAARPLVASEAPGTAG